MGDEVLLNVYGEIAHYEWTRASEIRQGITLDEFVVMPNHLHGVILIKGTVELGDAEARGVPGVGPRQVVGAHSCAPLHASEQPVPLYRQPRSLGSAIAGLKSIVTKRINETRRTPGAPVWQRNYYEHIIRNERELERARVYIANNPAKWMLDQGYPAVTPRPVPGSTNREPLR